MSSTSGMHRQQRWIGGTWGPVLLVLVALLACVLVLYRDTAIAMVTIWSRSETFAHAFTVPPIVAWLVWRKRCALAEQLPQPNAWLLLPIAAAGLIWLLGDLAAVNAVTQLAFTAMLVLVVVAVLGPRASRTIAFPLAFLFFSVPVGEFVMPQMMEWTADFTVFALRLSGIPVFREGQQFVIPSGNWSVVEACSGIRYLIASVMVGVLFAYLNYRSLSRRLTFVAVSIVVPVVANWIRAYLIVLVGHLSDNKLAAGVDHIIYGWVFFGLVITLMFLIGSRWTEAPAVSTTRRITPQAAPSPKPRISPLTVAVGAGILCIVPHIALWTATHSEHDGNPELEALSLAATGWSKLGEAEDTGKHWRPKFQVPSAYLEASYSKAGNEVAVHTAYYSNQSSLRKLITSENSLIPSEDAGWSLQDLRTQSIDIKGTPVYFRTATLRPPSLMASRVSPGIVAWQVYWIGGILTENDNSARAYIGIQRLLGRGDDAAAIVISTDESATSESAITLFLKENFDHILKQLAQTRDQRQHVEKY